MKEDYITDKKILLLCYDSNTNKINGQLLESAKYVNEVLVIRENDTITLKIGTTTIFNIFNKKKDAGFDVDVNGEKFVQFANEKVPINSLNSCRTTSQKRPNF